MKKNRHIPTTSFWSQSTLGSLFVMVAFLLTPWAQAERAHSQRGIASQPSRSIAPLTPGQVNHENEMGTKRRKLKANPSSSNNDWVAAADELPFWIEDLTTTQNQEGQDLIGIRVQKSPCQELKSRMEADSQVLYLASIPGCRGPASLVSQNTTLPKRSSSVRALNKAYPNGRGPSTLVIRSR